ncbi:hypothetical protein Q7A53_08910 [Halobacillus rhizosphaerae]|uniref:hypothetical protein n=1 Tax=Halobacillus rhizosphaerae TaxID=3064889 RepID=UPI00398B5F6E
MKKIKFLPHTINIPNFKVNTAGRYSSISFGQNYKSRRFVSNKKNQGFGEQNADDVWMKQPITWVNDADIIDGE